MITSIINTFNEEHHIEKCIKSLQSLDTRIIVVDSGSTDHTIQIAKECGADIHEVRRFQYVEQIREMSIDIVKNGWILILDADERMTPELALEIQDVTQHQTASQYTHFKIPRKNIMRVHREHSTTTWLRHGGWWPDYQIRFFQKEAFMSWPKHIHSTPKFKGSIGYFNHPINHLITSQLEAKIHKTLLFENMESDLLYHAGRPVSTPTFIRKFMGELFRRLILKMGFLDGSIGVMESMYQAYSKTITYLFLYEKYYKKKSSTV